MKINASFNNISDNARSNSQIAKKLAEHNADPNRFYDGPINENEDAADYLKLGAIKAVRLG